MSGGLVWGDSFSPGGAVSFVQYDKALQGRLTGKRHMEVLWRSRGWDGSATVTRNEARLRRPVLREVANDLRSRLQAGQAGSSVRIATDVADLENLDDPWVLLRHLAPLFAAVVGTADEGCPDAVNTTWLRRIVPDADEPNRSRWDTDPAWRVVQATPFDKPVPAPVRRLVRRKQRAQNVAKLDGQAIGIFVSRTAELHPNGGQYDISKAVAEAYVALEAESRKPGKDFGGLVRQRRKERGLPVPICDKVLPSVSSRRPLLHPPVVPVVTPVLTQRMLRSQSNRSCTGSWPRSEHSRPLLLWRTPSGGSGPCANSRCWRRPISANCLSLQRTLQPATDHQRHRSHRMNERNLPPREQHMCLCRCQYIALWHRREQPGTLVLRGAITKEATR